MKLFKPFKLNGHKQPFPQVFPQPLPHFPPVFANSSPSPVLPQYTRIANTTNPDYISYILNYKWTFDHGDFGFIVNTIPNNLTEIVTNKKLSFYQSLVLTHKPSFWTLEDYAPVGTFIGLFFRNSTSSTETLLYTIPEKLFKTIELL